MSNETTSEIPVINQFEKLGYEKQQTSTLFSWHLTLNILIHYEKSDDDDDE